jgi:hypothetical protein
VQQTIERTNAAVLERLGFLVEMRAYHDWPDDQFPEKLAPRGAGRFEHRAPVGERAAQFLGGFGRRSTRGGYSVELSQLAD